MYNSHDEYHQMREQGKVGGAGAALDKGLKGT
jgi:hypothetical protein